MTKVHFESERAPVNVYMRVKPRMLSSDSALF